MAIGIIMIHTGTFIIGKDNFTLSSSYIYSMTSLFVPTFFMISGYFYAKSRNKERIIINTIIQYIIYCILSIVLNIILLEYTYDINSNDILTLMHSVNYFWFVNSLIYYMLMFYAIDKLINKKIDIYFWCCILILFINVINLVKADAFISYQVLDIIYFLAGYLLLKFDFKISKKWLFVIILYPLFAQMQYQTINIFTLIFSLILFVTVKSVNMRETKFTNLSKDSLKILFIHYYIITAMSIINITQFTGYHIVINFAIAAISTLLILFTLNLILSIISNFYKARLTMKENEHILIEYNN